jgi:Sec-independent protein secretion pathway component TatC
MFNWAFNKIVKLREKVAVDLGGGDVEKPFLDHLDDLRTMIVRIVVTLLVVTVITFVFCEELVKVITYPLTLAGIADKVTLQNFKVVGGFMTAMNISLIAGVIISFPFLLYFLLQFVLPGLRTNEKKVLFPAIGVGGGLFLIGVVFAYYVVTPRALEFFYKFSVDIGAVAKANTQKDAPAVPPASSDGKQPVLTNGFGILWEITNPGVRNVVETSADGATWSALAATGPDGKAVEAKDFKFVRITSTAGAPAAGTPAPSSAPASSTPTSTAPVLATAAPFIWELTEYVKFICQFVLIFGMCFELPVVVMALVKLDVLNYKVMKTSRTWAAIIIAAVAAIITPTQDALTLGLLAVPMYLLYEICIWLAWYMEKRDRQLYPEYYKEQDEAAKQVDVADDWDNDSYRPWDSDDREEEEEESRSSTSTTAKPASPPAETSVSASDSESGDTTSGTAASAEAEERHAGESGSGPSTPDDSSETEPPAKPDDEPSTDKRNTD